MTEVEKAVFMYEKAVKKDLKEVDLEKSKLIKDLLTGDLGKRIKNIDTYKIEKVSGYQIFINKFKKLWSA